MTSIILCLLLFTFSACATMPNGQVAQTIPNDLKQYQESLLVNNNAPKWVIRGNGAFSDENSFYGVGTASGIRDNSLLRETADDRARNDLIKLLALDSASLMKDYRSSTATGDYQTYTEEQNIDSAIRTLTHATIAGIVIIDHWEHPKRNELFSLARLDLEKFKQSLDQVKQLNEKVRNGIKERADKLHKELKELEEAIKGKSEKLSLKEKELKEREAELYKKENALLKRDSDVNTVIKDQDTSNKAQNTVYATQNLDLKSEPKNVRYARTKYGTILYDRHGNMVEEKKEWYSDIVAFFGVAAIIATVIFFH